MSHIAVQVLAFTVCAPTPGHDSLRDPVLAVALENRLGFQTNDTATLFAPVVRPPIDAAKHQKLSRCDIAVSVVPGRKHALLNFENPTV
jgi:hypothetical protein